MGILWQRPVCNPERIRLDDVAPCLPLSGRPDFTTLAGLFPAGESSANISRSFIMTLVLLACVATGLPVGHAIAKAFGV